MDQVWKLKKKAVDKVNKEEKNKYKTLKDLSFILSLFNHPSLVYTTYPNFFMPNGTLTQSFTSVATQTLTWSSSIQQVPAIITVSLGAFNSFQANLIIGFSNTPGLVASPGSGILTGMSVSINTFGTPAQVVVSENGTVHQVTGTVAGVTGGSVSTTITLDVLASNSTMYGVQIPNSSLWTSYVYYNKTTPSSQALYFTVVLFANSVSTTTVSIVQTPNNLLPSS